MKVLIFSVITALSLAVFPIFPAQAYAASSNERTYTVQQEKILHGNYSSGIFHNAYCKHYNCRKCTVIFKSAKEAREKGFRACKKCGG